MTKSQQKLINSILADKDVKQLNLKELLEAIVASQKSVVKGDKLASKIFKAPPRTCQTWRLGERLPRPKKAMEIIKIMNGVITLDGVYN